MPEHTDVVAAVKADLLARGYDLSGPCGAFAIVSRVAWQVRAEGWGPVFSTGNGCDTNGTRYRADTLMLPDGTCIDCLQKAESDNGDTSNPAAYNIPQWVATGAQPPSNWRAPWNPDAGVPLPPDPPPVPPGGCPCEAQIAALREALTIANAQLIAMRADIDLLVLRQPPVYQGRIFGVPITLTPVQ